MVIARDFRDCGPSDDVWDKGVSQVPFSVDGVGERQLNAARRNRTSAKLKANIAGMCRGAR
jgi:hypothetical protein